jgi:hypothetical protein
MKKRDRREGKEICDLVDIWRGADVVEVRKQERAWERQVCDPVEEGTS